MQKTGFLGMWNKTDYGESMFQEYAEIMGLEDAETTGYGWHSGKGIDYEYKKGDDTEEGYVSYDDIAEVVAEKRMQKEAAAIASSVNKMTSRIIDMSNSDSATD
jgi:hypothetical protein